jgi:3-phosphoshikimate 1-carboxyvinyltransferase
MEKTVIPGAVEGDVDPPSSKSYAIRAIAADFLAGGRSVLHGLESVEPCDDVVAAFNVVKALGEGRGTLDVGESGLSARLFTPIAALSHSPVTITGHGSILHRPMAMMVRP